MEEKGLLTHIHTKKKKKISQPLTKFKLEIGINPLAIRALDLWSG